MKSIEDNIFSSINSVKDEIIKHKDIVIKNLQNENKMLRRKCERLEKRAKYESYYNAFAQYGSQNNMCLEWNSRIKF